MYDKEFLFRDVTSLFKNAECIKELDDTLYEMYKNSGITKVVGIESRGFIMGASLAIRLGAGFVPARKPGKLPAETISESYNKEYGTDSIEIHKDAIEEGRISKERYDNYKLLYEELKNIKRY